MRLKYGSIAEGKTGRQVLDEILRAMGGEARS
jgi:hypothetical protein